MEEEVKVEEKPEAEEAKDDFTEFARKAVEKVADLTPEQKDAIVRAFAEAHAEYEKGAEEEAEREIEGTRDEEGAVVDSDEAEAEVETEDEDIEAKAEEKAEDECAKDEDETEEKKNGAMDANTVAKIVRAQISAQYEAASAVKPFIGAVDPMAYDSAEAIYAEAVKKMTRKSCALDSAKDVFTAVSAVKSDKTTAMDSASKPSGVMAFLASKLNH